MYFPKDKSKKFTVMPIKPVMVGGSFSFSTFHQEGGMFGPGKP